MPPLIFPGWGWGSTHLSPGQPHAAAAGGGRPCGPRGERNGRGTGAWGGEFWGRRLRRRPRASWVAGRPADFGRLPHPRLLSPPPPPPTQLLGNSHEARPNMRACTCSQPRYARVRVFTAPTCARARVHSPNVRACTCSQPPHARMRVCTALICVRARAHSPNMHACTCPQPQHARTWGLCTRARAHTGAVRTCTRAYGGREHVHTRILGL